MPSEEYFGNMFMVNDQYVIVQGEGDVMAFDTDSDDSLSKKPITLGCEEDCVSQYFNSTYFILANNFSANLTTFDGHKFSKAGEIVFPATIEIDEGI
mmetsp:Transcript_667/g.616  ORF Transcript_667/g.616 Transcript_667/m.616 type:complete len:97 (-) Transcript_667:980-1270(-)